MLKIHYAKKNTVPDKKWQDKPCEVLICSRKAPRNWLVQTEVGKVVVPRWNVREAQP